MKLPQKIIYGPYHWPPPGDGFDLFTCRLSLLGPPVGGRGRRPRALGEGCGVTGRTGVARWDIQFRRRSEAVAGRVVCGGGILPSQGSADR